MALTTWASKILMALTPSSCPRSFLPYVVSLAAASASVRPVTASVLSCSATFSGVKAWAGVANMLSTRDSIVTLSGDADVVWCYWDPERGGQQDSVPGQWMHRLTCKSL